MSAQHDLQVQFTKLIAQFILWIYEQPGYAVTFAEFTNLEHVGHMTNSLHYDGLAADMNFFLNGVWQEVDSPDYRKLGAKWKTLNPLCAWGGDFGTVDLDHYSMRFGGRS